MRKEYDFSESKRTPYARHLRKPVTIRLGTDVIDYFKAMAQETGIPYQRLIDFYLMDCVRSRRKLSMKWVS